MVKYIYDMRRIMPGDIILTRDLNSEISRRVMESTHSEYSHAMLYVGGSSYIEADKRVGARNIARRLFLSQNDTCVLRVKKNYLTPITIDAAIYYARFVVGNPYSLLDAIRLEQGVTDKSSDDTQICTRLVAKAYAFARVNIVDNVEMCTPQQLLESKYVSVHRDLLRIANDFDIRFAESYDVIDDMVASTERLFDSLKAYSGGKIRTMNALTEYVMEHPDDDEAISSLLINSGYLKVLEIEEEKNRYNYDKDVFIDFYGVDNAYEAAICVLEENFSGRYRYEQEYCEIENQYLISGSKSQYLRLMRDLYRRIIEQHERRIKVCYAVMNDPKT